MSRSFVSFAIIPILVMMMLTSQLLAIPGPSSLEEWRELSISNKELATIDSLVREITRVNGWIANPNMIFPGQVLVVVKPAGDTLKVEVWDFLTTERGAIWNIAKECLFGNLAALYNAPRLADQQRHERVILEIRRQEAHAVLARLNEAQARADSLDAALQKRLDPYLVLAGVGALVLIGAGWILLVGQKNRESGRQEILREQAQMAQEADEIKRQLDPNNGESFLRDGVPEDPKEALVAFQTLAQSRYSDGSVVARRFTPGIMLNSRLGPGSFFLTQVAYQDGSFAQRKIDHGDRVHEVTYRIQEPVGDKEDAKPRWREETRLVFGSCGNEIGPHIHQGEFDLGKELTEDGWTFQPVGSVAYVSDDTGRIEVVRVQDIAASGRALPELPLVQVVQTLVPTDQPCAALLLIRDKGEVRRWGATAEQPIVGVNLRDNETFLVHAPKKEPPDFTHQE